MKRQPDIACNFHKRPAKKTKLDDKNASVPPSKSVTVKRDVEPDVGFVKTETKSMVMEKIKEERS